MNGFSFDLTVALIAYVMSFVGCALGLLCAARRRTSGQGQQGRWLVLAALSIGGTGIWVMHFVAMLGSDVTGTPVRYDVSLTIISMIVAVVVVGIGLHIVGVNPEQRWRYPAAGLLTGSGVAIMHYVGMAAINVHGELHYDVPTVVASVLIAVVAATAALWFALHAGSTLTVLGAALIMGFAVSGMHHTGMAAASVALEAHSGAPDGMTGQSLLLPLVIGISFLTAVTLAVVALSPSEEELEEDRRIEEGIARFHERQRLL
jgi:NO-binding membrane sensor protein with MHYT domain